MQCKQAVIKRPKKRRRQNEYLPEDLVAPAVIHRWPRKRLIRLAPTQSADIALGDLVRGCEVVGVNKGQFSLPDLLDAILCQIGTADVVIWTFTLTTESIDRLAELQKTGAIGSLRFMLDRSFQGREPHYCARLLEVFGNSAIRTTRNHAKLLQISGGGWQLTVLTTANFTRNPRLEFFELSDDPALFSFFDAITTELFGRSAEFNFDFFDCLPDLGHITLIASNRFCLAAK